MLFEQHIPFRFLTPAQQQSLRAHLSLEAYDTGQRIFGPDDRFDQRVFILLEGQIGIYARQSAEHRKLLRTVEPGQYFGERAAVLGMARGVEAIANAPSQCAWMEGSYFLELLESSPSFGHALGNILREKQGLLHAFDAFVALLLHGASENTVNFRKLLARYQALEPALHPHSNDRDTIDFEALSYALPRLPENITQAYMLFLTDNLHELFSRTTGTFTPISTRARRRTVYEMMPGKIMVLLRDGLSDWVDFASCLCALTTETRKIRHRLARPTRLAMLADALAGPALSTEDEETLLRALGCFDEKECAALRRLWPEGTCQHLYEITLHHEDFHIELTKQLQGYNQAHAELWTRQIADATLELIGCAPNALPPDIDVHIISSNTHSVMNCLSPYLHRHAPAIEAWGKQHHPELYAIDWPVKTDRLYAVARHYFAAHPEAQAKRLHTERKSGLLELPEAGMTGIVVELIDTEKLSFDAVDPFIFTDEHNGPQAPPSPNPPRALIVNIDYAFGQQAEEILSNLLMLFGPNVRSVNILGKAGALQGIRGDLLVANSFVEQTQDLLHPLPSRNWCDAKRLARRLPNRGVHEGAILTVAGTLLQNRTLLHFYKNIWRCVGLEMEGTFYLREVLKAVHLGVIYPEVETRFLYYVSDVPLQAGETLAGSLRSQEGIPPLYAITREILAGVLRKTPQPCEPNTA